MKCAVAIPVYKTVPCRVELLSLFRLKQLQVQNVVLVGPDGLDIGVYRKVWPGIPFERFGKHCFSGIDSYNALMLSGEFYERFSGGYEWLLIHQLDAFLFSGGIDYFCDLPYDYFGSPWRGGQLLFPGTNNAKMLKVFGKRVYVGNGGLSLRRIGATLELLKRRRKSALNWRQNEDGFFSYWGSCDKVFHSCTPEVASLFAFEAEADYWYGVNQCLPLGCHAFEKNVSFFYDSVLVPMLHEVERFVASQNRPLILPS